MTFFRGTPDGKGAHDDLGRKIGLSGKNWARDHWRKQDMAAYMCTSAPPSLSLFLLVCRARSSEDDTDFPPSSLVRLVLEWARLLHRSDDDHQNLDFDMWE
jgi:hypothetical protein